MADITLTIKLFGAFRDYVSQPIIEMNLRSGITVRDIKATLDTQLLSQGCAPSISQLIEESVLASNDSIQSADDLIETPGEYALLPPVCGG